MAQNRQPPKVCFVFNWPFRVRVWILVWQTDWSSFGARLRYSAVYVLYSNIVDFRKHLILVYSFFLSETSRKEQQQEQQQ